MSDLFDNHTWTFGVVFAVFRRSRNYCLSGAPLRSLNSPRKSDDSLRSRSYAKHQCDRQSRGLWLRLQTSPKTCYARRRLLRQGIHACCGPGGSASHRRAIQATARRSGGRQGPKSCEDRGAGVGDDRPQRCTVPMARRDPTRQDWVSPQQGVRTATSRHCASFGDRQCLAAGRCEEWGLGHRIPRSACWGQTCR